MSQVAIFGPILAMFILTFVVWVYMYARRIPFLRSLDLPPEKLTPAVLVQRSPPSVSNPSDNLKNLFEIPIVFYVLALYLYVTNQVDAVYVVASWVFVLFRVLHSAVHCTINIVLLRFFLYLVACLSVWFILFRAALGYFR